jgi:phosphopantetheinyl transferase (holo-ACP synthase)
LRSESLDIWLTSDAAPAHFDSDKLSCGEHARFGQIRSRRRRKAFELSRGLLQALPPPDRPQSLSHSGSFAAVARCPVGLSVGVDVEAHRIRDAISLSRFAFHEAEADAVAAVKDPLSLFYALWVLKEAAAKALDLQLIHSLRECVFMPEPAQWRGILPTRRPWRAHVWQPWAGLSLAAVVIGKEGALRTRTLEGPANEVPWAEIVSLSGGGATAL